MYNEILAAAKDADRDPDVRVVILTGAGTVFSAGQDQSHTAGRSPTSYVDFVITNYTAQNYLRTMSKPVIGRINGPAAGGGLTMALISCDIVVASTNARFGLREVQTGIVRTGNLNDQREQRFRAVFWQIVNSADYAIQR